MKNTGLPAIILSIIFALSSCSEGEVFAPIKIDDDTPDGYQFLPVTSDTYWIYENFGYDESGNPRTDSITYDSTYVSGEEEKDGKMATVYTEYTSETGEAGPYEYSRDQYYISEGSKLFTHSSYFLDGLPDMFSSIFNFEEDWIKLADINDDDWEVFRIKIREDDSLDMMGMLVTGDIESRGEKGKFDSITTKAGTFQTQEFVFETNLDLDIIMPGIPIPLGLKLEIVQRYYFAEGIGLIKLYTEPYEFNLLIVATNEPASSSELIRYLIK